MLAYRRSTDSRVSFHRFFIASDILGAKSRKHLSLLLSRGLALEKVLLLLMVTVRPVAMVVRATDVAYRRVYYPRPAQALRNPIEN